MNLCLPEPGSALWNSAVALRRNVLRKPLGLDFSESELAEEHHQTLVVLEQQDLCRACLMLVAVSDTDIKMRQVAVDPAFQQQGLGKTLVQWAEKHAAEKGFTRIVLHARNTAVLFYLKQGYAKLEPGFLEVGLPHHRMEKWLPV